MTNFTCPLRNFLEKPGSGIAFMLCITLLSLSSLHAQTKIKDGTISSSALPNTNAVLELESNNKGLLLPRVTLTGSANAAPLTAHTAGMTVYNTATAGDVTPGYYYNDGSKWVRINQPEPWRVQNSTTEATGNTQDIYQMGRVAINKNTTVKQLEVGGDLKAHYDNGTYHSGINTNTLAELGASMNLLYVADNADLLSASQVSTVNLSPGIASMQSTNGVGGGNVATFASPAGGSVGIVANNSAGDAASALWAYNDATGSNLTFYHRKTAGEGTQVTVEKLAGVTFDFIKTDQSREGSYVFPRTAGLTNQVLAVNTNSGGTNGESTLAWKDIKNIIGTLPTYANDAAADSDTNLPSGGLYKLTGSRAVYQKP